jgi:tetratricopeptide (TPR) repeat protein
VPLVILTSGCLHYNAVFNARRLFSETDRLRRVGLDSTSFDAYTRVIEGAKRGIEAEGGGKWADDALLLIGQSRLRLREFPQAREAFKAALRQTDNEEVRQAARMFLGAVAVELNEPERALGLLDSVPQISNGILRGEGHLWRARAQIALGPAREVWRHLDAAREADESFSAPGELLRLGWGVQSADTAMAFQGLQALMANSDARLFGDSIRTILDGMARDWGPEIVVRMMTGAQRADWSRSERHALLLQRARLAHSVGDTVLAHTDAERVAGGVGDIARAARVQIAVWRLARVSQLPQLGAIRALLLPAVEAPRARDLLNGIRRVEFLVDTGLNGEAVAYFAAAEQAKEVLHADALAGALYLAYSDSDSDGPWLGKALLAARDLYGKPARRLQIDQRLGRIPESEYVRYARTGESDEVLVSLEERLQSALTDILGRVEMALLARRLLLLDPGTSPSPPLP